MQTLIVIVIVVAAAAYLVFTLRRSLRPGGGGCCSCDCLRTANRDDQGQLASGQKAIAPEQLAQSAWDCREPTTDSDQCDHDL